jgi:hypothetical protein
MSRFDRLLSNSPVISQLLVRALEQPEAEGALRYISPWAGLRDLVGETMSPETLLDAVGRLHRDQAFLTLAQIAGDIANAQNVAGSEADTTTRKLLMDFANYHDPRGRIVADAVAKLPPDRPIVHAQVVFALQALTVVCGSAGTEQPPGSYLAYLLLGLNDHIPEWPCVAAQSLPDDEPITDTERTLAVMFLSSIFNRKHDDARFLVRILEVMGKVTSTPLPKGGSWADVEREAFGCPFATYAESFLAPLVTLATGWGFQKPPIVDPTIWDRSASVPALARRWFQEASQPIEQAARSFADRPLRSGLYGLSQSFFRVPFLRIGGVLVGVSPWHMHDFAELGTWSQLNRTCKKVLRSNSNDAFSAAFGYSFERWCAELAREAATLDVQASERLIVPSAPGAHGEIEDIVFHDDDTIVLFSAKASLVPEATLKTADTPDDAIRWLRRFFFEDVADAKRHGHRGGAVRLLDRKIARIRAGAFEAQGLPRTAAIVPVIISFDNLGESPILYKWLETEAHRKRLLFHRDDVSPLAVIRCEDYETLMALKAQGHRVCRLLREKTTIRNKWQRLAVFLYDRFPDAGELRLPSMKARFDALISCAVERIRPVPEGRSHQP